MLPLNPPARLSDPGYPVRSQALADDDSRRRLHGILAASVLGLALGGCGGGTTAVQPAGGQVQPAAQQQPAQPAPQPAQPVRALPGEASAPTPAIPQPLGGKPAIPQPAPAEPAALRGDVAVPAPPPPVKPAPAQPAPKAEAPKPEAAEPRPMMGLMIAPQAPPHDPA